MRFYRAEMDKPAILPYTIITDREKVDLKFLFEQLSTSYWAAGRTKEKIKVSVEHSICFSVYQGDVQVGFARVVTDRAVFGYIADVVVAPEHRGRGLGKKLMAAILAHPDLAGTKLLLETRDAHGLYEQFGFARKECMKLVLPKEF